MFKQSDRDHLANIERVLIEVTARDIRVLTMKVIKMSEQLDKLTADVAAQQTAINSLIALNDATQASLATLIAQGSATPDDLTAVTASIEASTAAIVADLAKTTTPAAPAPAASTTA